MNKLDVALKLLLLLNERKSIDSRLVADELNVSLRTAQRYLLDLSSLPCVITHEKDHAYSLASGHLKDSLLEVSMPARVNPGGRQAGEEALSIGEAVCLRCGIVRQKQNIRGRDNRQNIEQMVSLVRRKLRERKCSFP